MGERHGDLEFNIQSGAPVSPDEAWASAQKRVAGTSASHLSEEQTAVADRILAQGNLGGVELADGYVAPERVRGSADFSPHTDAEYIVADEILGQVPLREMSYAEAQSNQYYEVFEESLRLKNVLIRLRELMLDAGRTPEEREKILTRVNAVSNELDQLEAELKSLKS